ncbi:hypothetical protein YC2023_014401 [Brassica napus]
MITLCLLCKHRLLEGTIRSVNNLLQKFRQSSLHTAFALLVAPFPVVAASLYIDGYNSLTKVTHNPAETSNHGNGKDAAKQVFALHLLGFIVTLLPYIICQVPSQHSSTNRSIMYYNIFFASLYNLCHNPRLLPILLSSQWN